MTTIKNGTQKANEIIRDLSYRTSWKSIYDAYERPSRIKVDTFEEIRRRAYETEGYNYDLHVCGANSSQYSTVYSYTQNGKTYVVKDTKCNTYIVEM